MSVQAKPPRFLRLPEVISRTGRSCSMIYAGMAKGTFPGQYRLGEKAVGWLEADIDQWIAARPAARRRQPKVSQPHSEAAE